MHVFFLLRSQEHMKQNVRSPQHESTATAFSQSYSKPTLRYILFQVLEEEMSLQPSKHFGADDMLH